MGDVPTYKGWRAVPGHLWSKTQLADNDLPRVPAGPVRAHVDTADWRGKPATVALYDARESVPSRASAAQLDAARRRGSPRRPCADCGAQPERPLPPPDRDAIPRCPACAHIATLRAKQAEVAQLRAEAARWAAQRLADTTTAVVHVEAVLRPPAPSGRQNRNPIALRVEALDATGAELLTATIRTAGRGTRAMPDDAVDPADVAEQVRKVLILMTPVTWYSHSAGPLWEYVLEGERPRGWYAGNPHAMRSRVANWRGETDPHDGQLRMPLPPGRADRMLLLLHRMADSNKGAKDRDE